MGYSDSIRSILSSWKNLAGGEEPCRSDSHWCYQSALSISWVWQKALIAFYDSTRFEGLLHTHCSISAGPSSCPGPQPGSQSIDGRFSWWLGLQQSSVMKTSVLHKYNRNYLHYSRTFAASFLRFGQATTAQHIRNTSHHRRRVSEISSKSVYNANAWK